MKDIKEILGELNSISCVFKQQLKIVRAMIDDDQCFKVPPQNHPGRGKELANRDMGSVAKEGTLISDSKYSSIYQTLKGRQQDIEDLKTECTRVYKAVSVK